jgi:hypothetical protein
MKLVLRHVQRVALAYCPAEHVGSDGVLACSAATEAACREGRCLRLERRKSKGERRKVGEKEGDGVQRVAKPEESDVRRENT